nr:hypothetical protein [Tanacetum cinerariifolium]
MMLDEPNVAAAFMVNLSSSSSQINEVRTFNDNIFETISPSWPSEVPQDEHLDSDDDSVQEDYTISYDEYLATKESQDVPTEASLIPPTAAYMLQTLTDLTTQVEGHRKVNQEQALVNATLFAKLDQCKLELARLERNKVKLECDQVIVARNKRNAELEQETELLQTTLRNKEATIASLTSETKTVLSEKKTLEDKYLEEIVCLKMLTKLQLFVPQNELSREQVYCLSASDIASQSSDPPKPMTPFVHTRPVNSEKQFFDLQVKVQNYKECLHNQKVCEQLNATASNAIFEINKLKAQLQEKDDTIRHLHAKKDILGLLNVGSTESIFETKALETKIAQLKEEKIATQKAEIATLKGKAIGKKNSGPTGTPTKPKVLTSRIYTKSSKYIPPQKRTDWVQPTLLPKKKQVTFLEPHKTLPRSTEKPPVQHKKPTISLNMFPKAKPATKPRKPIPKRNTQNHNPLPAKSVKARRAADYYRNLYVDISQFVDRSMKSVHVKPHQEKRVVNTSTNARFSDYRLSDRKAGSNGISSIFY